MKKTFKRKTFEGGNLKQFNKSLERQIENRSDFKIVSSGLSRTIVFDSGLKFRYFSNSHKDNIKGSYFVNLVRKQVDKFIESDSDMPNYTERINAQSFNIDGIRKAIENDVKVECIDLNSCYWTTAYNLGFIDKRLFNKGIESGHKQGLVVSIGALNKLPLIESYTKGSIVSRKYDYDFNNRYSPFYWSIITKVRDVMMEVYEALGDDLYMWLTDCAFVNSSRKDEVVSIFEKHMYKYKSYESKFTKLSKLKVNWIDMSKEKNKEISIANRHIQNEYKLWEIVNNFNKEQNEN